MSIVGGGQTNGAELFAIAQLLADPAKLKAEHDRLNSLREQAEAIFKLVGPAQDILKLREEVIADRAKAAKEFARAQEEAREVMVAARRSASDIARAAERDAAETRDKIGALLDEAKLRRDEVAKQLQALSLKGAAVEKTQALLDRAVKDAEVAIAAARAEAEALKAERARLSEVVAKLADELRVHR